MVNHTVVIASVAACFHDALYLISYQSPLTAMLKLLQLNFNKRSILVDS